MQVPFSVFVQAVRSNDVLAVAIDDRYSALYASARTYCNSITLRCPDLSFNRVSVMLSAIPAYV